MDQAADIILGVEDKVKELDHSIERNENLKDHMKERECRNFVTLKLVWSIVDQLKAMVGCGLFEDWEKGNADKGFVSDNLGK